MTTQLTELPESRVRIEAEVPAGEVERRLEAAARQLGRSLKMPGFRNGKIPAPVVIRRVGRDAVLDEAVRDSIGGWYAAAVNEAKIAPVGDPSLELGSMPREGEALTFTIEIGVRPAAQLGDWEGLEVPRREPEANEEEVDREIEQVRDRLARLEAVERAAGLGDFVVMDYAGTIDGEPIEGGAASGQLLELGASRLIPGFEEGLVGAKAGEQRTLELKFPDEYGSPELAGRDARFEVSIKEVKEKQLPELDDDFALNAAGFDTLEELREELRGRLREADAGRVEREFREAAVDAVIERATLTVPPALVEARATEAWERAAHSMSHQGITKEAYLQLAKKTEAEILEESRPDAERALKREAIIAALVETLALEPTEEDLIDALREQVEPDESGKTPDPKKLFSQLRKAGRLGALREDIAAKQAVDALVATATPIAPERAAARDKLWTPESR
ncbi:MAG: trigger factor [Solirubrobacteraceae bacterium]